MSIRVEIPSSNVFIGTSADITRVASLSHVRVHDAQRRAWTELLKTVMSESFLGAVMKNDSFFALFKFEIGTKEAPEECNGVVAYQNLSQLRDLHVPARLTPWQMRVEFAPKALSLMTTIPLFMEKELSDLFAAAQWKFWLTETGFCITPLPLFLELEGHSIMFKAWQDARDFRGSGFSDFPTEDAADLSDMPPLEDAHLLPTGLLNAAAVPPPRAPQPSKAVKSTADNRTSFRMASMGSEDTQAGGGSNAAAGAAGAASAAGGGGPGVARAWGSGGASE
jgi:hypothetical protein